VVQVLDSAPLPVTSKTLYRVRLEAIQNELRVYVDGRLVLEATDTSHPWGRYGAITFKAAASYDDVLVTQP
jgi:pectate lyase